MVSSWWNPAATTFNIKRLPRSYFPLKNMYDEQLKTATILRDIKKSIELLNPAVVKQFALGGNGIAQLVYQEYNIKNLQSRIDKCLDLYQKGKDEQALIDLNNVITFLYLEKDLYPYYYQHIEKVEKCIIDIYFRHNQYEKAEKIVNSSIVHNTPYTFFAIGNIKLKYYYTVLEKNKENASDSYLDCIQNQQNGVAKEIHENFLWSHQRGCKEATLALANLCYNGLLVKKDVDKAVDYCAALLRDAMHIEAIKEDTLTLLEKIASEKNMRAHCIIINAYSKDRQCKKNNSKLLKAHGEKLVEILHNLSSLPLDLPFERFGTMQVLREAGFAELSNLLSLEEGRHRNGSLSPASVSSEVVTPTSSAPLNQWTRTINNIAKKDTQSLEMLKGKINDLLNNKNNWKDLKQSLVQIPYSTCEDIEKIAKNTDESMSKDASYVLGLIYYAHKDYERAYTYFIQSNYFKDDITSCFFCLKTRAGLGQSNLVRDALEILSLNNFLTNFKETVSFQKIIKVLRNINASLQSGLCEDITLEDSLSFIKTLLSNDVLVEEVLPTLKILFSLYVPRNETEKESNTCFFSNFFSYFKAIEMSGLFRFIDQQNYSSDKSQKLFDLYSLSVETMLYCYAEKQTRSMLVEKIKEEDFSFIMQYLERLQLYIVPSEAYGTNSVQEKFKVNVAKLLYIFADARAAAMPSDMENVISLLNAAIKYGYTDVIKYKAILLMGSINNRELDDKQRKTYMYQGLNLIQHYNETYASKDITEKEEYKHIKQVCKDVSEWLMQEIVISSESTLDEKLRCCDQAILHGSEVAIPQRSMLLIYDHEEELAKSNVDIISEQSHNFFLEHLKIVESYLNTIKNSHPIFAKKLAEACGNIWCTLGRFIETDSLELIQKKINFFDKALHYNCTEALFFKGIFLSRIVYDSSIISSEQSDILYETSVALLEKYLQEASGKNTFLSKRQALLHLGVFYHRRGSSSLTTFDQINERKKKAVSYLLSANQDKKDVLASLLLAKIYSEGVHKEGNLTEWVIEPNPTQAHEYLLSFIQQYEDQLKDPDESYINTLKLASIDEQYPQACLSCALLMNHYDKENFSKIIVLYDKAIKSNYVEAKAHKSFFLWNHFNEGVKKKKDTVKQLKKWMNSAVDLAESFFNESCESDLKCKIAAHLAMVYYKGKTLDIKNKQYTVVPCDYYKALPYINFVFNYSKNDSKIIYAKLLADIYNNGIKNKSSQEWLLKPDPDKAIEYLSHTIALLKEIPLKEHNVILDSYTNMQHGGIHSYVYATRGKLYYEKGMLKEAEEDFLCVYRSEEYAKYATCVEEWGVNILWMLGMIKLSDVSINDCKEAVDFFKQVEQSSNNFRNWLVAPFPQVLEARIKMFLTLEKLSYDHLYLFYMAGILLYNSSQEKSNPEEKSRGLSYLKMAASKGHLLALRELISNEEITVQDLSSYERLTYLWSMIKNSHYSLEKEGDTIRKGALESLYRLVKKNALIAQCYVICYYASSMLDIEQNGKDINPANIQEIRENNDKIRSIQKLLEGVLREMYTCPTIITESSTAPYLTILMQNRGYSVLKKYADECKNNTNIQEHTVKAAFLLAACLTFTAAFSECKQIEQYIENARSYLYAAQQRGAGIKNILYLTQQLLGRTHCIVGRFYEDNGKYYKAIDEYNFAFLLGSNQGLDCYIRLCIEQGHYSRGNINTINDYLDALTKVAHPNRSCLLLAVKHWRNLFQLYDVESYLDKAIMYMNKIKDLSDDEQALKESCEAMKKELKQKKITMHKSKKK